MPKKSLPEGKMKTELRRSGRLQARLPVEPLAKKPAAKKPAKAKKAKPVNAENSDAKTEQAQKAEAPADAK